MLNTLINDESFVKTIGYGTGLKGKRVIVQGFGNVGYYFAHFCHEAGAKIVGIIEKDGGIYNSNGFNPDDVKMFLSQPGKNISNYPDVEKIEINNPTKIMAEECEIFAPCASDGTIRRRNANLIKAKIVIEGANGPTTFVGDTILAENGV